MKQVMRGKNDDFVAKREHPFVSLRRVITTILGAEITEDEAQQIYSAWHLQERAFRLMTQAEMAKAQADDFLRHCQREIRIAK